MGRATILIVGCTALLACAVGCTALISGQPLEDSIVFQAHAKPADNWAHDRDIEDAWFPTANGSRLHGWFAEARQPRAVVLYAHGNAENVADLRPVLRRFRDDLNVSVLVFDYQGYGRSEGAPTGPGVLADARAARRWLADRAKVAETDIVLAGRSVGGGVVVDLAAGDGRRGLILENTFSSLPDTAASHLPLLPVRTLMRTRFDSAAKIPNYRGPLLQTHGDADRVIPFALGRKLFDAANEPKQFVPARGGDHNDPPSREYLAALDRFIASLPAAR